MALDIPTGQMTSYDGDHSLQPLDASATPGVQRPTPIQPGQLSGPTYDGRDTRGEYAAPLLALEADVRAAQAAGMSAEHDRRDHYSVDILPPGAAYGDAMDIPPVPDAAVPPAMSDLYPYSGLEPTAAEAGMSGSYPSGP
jgi:hypothetical protein